MSTTANLARVLVASAKRQQYAAFNGHFMARALLADPEPLLAALAEAGVLVEEWGYYNPAVDDSEHGVRGTWGEVEARAMVEFWDDPETCVAVRRYVTPWQEKP